MTTPAGPASSPRRDRMLSELAAELRAARDEHRRDVAQLRADLEGLSTLVGENADLLGQVVPRVSDLDDGLADLADRLVALAAASGAEEKEDKSGPVDWLSLSADAAAAEWEALGEWIATVLGPVYEITREQLPDCWALHRPVVVELVWLRRAFAAAHRPNALPSAAADWHTRWRRETFANIGKVIDRRWCRPGAHYVDRHEQRPVHDDGAPRQRPTPPPPHLPGQRPIPISAEEQITDAQYWIENYRAASSADLAWRRQREAATPDNE